MRDLPAVNARVFGVLALAVAAATIGCGGGSAATAPAPVPTPAPTPAPTARYEVVFEASWHESTHSVPPDPHFSRLIGGTHGEAVRFWEEGGIASEGIKRMAEIGAQAPLDEEVLAAVTAGTAGRLIADERRPENPGTTSIEFEVTRAFPLVTLVTMVAPSPDWFVGVSGYPLFVGGDWVAEAEVPLVPWDAGTDSGADFLSPDRPTRPRQPIARIVTPPLAEDGVARPLGRFVFRRLP